MLFLPFPLKPDTRTPEQKRKDFEFHWGRHVVDWDEDRTKFDTRLVLNHETYRTTPLFDVKPVVYTGDKSVFDQEDVVAKSPSGNWLYYHRILPFYVSLPLAQNKRRGTVLFSGDVHFPVLMEVNHKRVSDGVWMSLTPMEALTQRQAVRMAKGDVMVGGLGLGWLLQKVCAKKSVKRVRLVEIDNDQIEWLRPAIEKAHPHVKDKQVEWVADNAWHHVDCYGPGTVNLIDVWDGYGSASGNERLEAARKNGAKVWAWGEGAYDNRRY